MTWGTALDEGATVLIGRDLAEPLAFEPDMETIIGRFDPGALEAPTLILLPTMRQLGVSRRHGMIRRGSR